MIHTTLAETAARTCAFGWMRSASQCNSPVVKNFYSVKLDALKVKHATAYAAAANQFVTRPKLVRFTHKSPNGLNRKATADTSSKTNENQDSMDTSSVSSSTSSALPRPTAKAAAAPETSPTADSDTSPFSCSDSSAMEGVDWAHEEPQPQLPPPPAPPPKGSKGGT